MDRRWTNAWIVVLGLVLVVGCGEDETGGEIREQCPDDECVDCEGHLDCEGSTHCHDEEGVCVQIECEDDEDCTGDTRCSQGYCAGDVCSPGESICDETGTAVRRCSDDGAGFGEPEECAQDICVGGRCGCENDGDCGEDEECQEFEICEDGDCETVRQCRVDCPGEVCGFQGDVCCEGDEPVCGPDGECAPDCEGQGELCGEEFDECCPAGEVCVFGNCVEPGEECEDFTDCGLDEYCDDALGRCLPDDFPDDLVCEIAGDFDPFAIEETWHWDGLGEGVEDGIELDRRYHNVQSIPVTADMTDDGTPEVVITPYHDDDQHVGVLAVVDGVDGETVYHNATRTFSGQGHSAVGDVTGDGRPEIATVLGDEDEGVAVVENPANCPDPEADEDDCIRWESREGTVDRYNNGLGPVIADINDDGEVEVVFGTAVFDGYTGEMIADGDSSSRGTNRSGASWGSPSVADLDDSGTLELITGDCAWKVDFEDGQLDEYWCTEEFDNGMVGVADVVASGDRAGDPEVVTVRSGTVWVLDGQTGDVIHHIDIPGGGAGGTPNIADFDGDGTVEIGLPGQQCYSVFDLDCLEETDEPGECDQPDFDDCTPGEDCLVYPCDAPGLSDGSGDGVLWSIEVQDDSEATGSSVFDFQGNDRNEVVYNDECRLLVLDGQTGQPLIARLNTTRTATEYPLVVDVNDDGRSNIAVIANNDQYDRDCEHFLDESSPTNPDWFPECFPEDMDDRPDKCDTGTTGVFALEDVHDAWVSTRPMWNQHAYHITNIEDDGTLPDDWQAPWKSHNTFRANAQGERPLNAPDVVVSSVHVDAISCPLDLEFRVTIRNEGIASIPEGMPVSLYLFEEGASTGELVETKTLDEAISPGGVVQIEFEHTIDAGQVNEELDFEVVANDDGSGDQPVRDCNPDKASAWAEQIICHFAG